MPETIRVEFKILETQEVATQMFNKDFRTNDTMKMMTIFNFASKL